MHVKKSDYRGPRSDTKWGGGGLKVLWVLGDLLSLKMSCHLSNKMRIFFENRNGFYKHQACVL